MNNDAMYRTAQGLAADRLAEARQRRQVVQLRTAAKYREERERNGSA